MSNEPKREFLDLAGQTESVLCFSQANDVIVTFDRNGHIEVNPKYNVEDAAKAFWAAVIAINQRDSGKNISHDKRIALGELKNLAGWLMDQEPTRERMYLIGALVLRMQQVIIQSDAMLYAVTDADIEEALETAAIVDGTGGSKPN